MYNLEAASAMYSATEPIDDQSRSLSGTVDRDIPTLRLPIHIMSHSDLAHRHHLLLTTLTARLIVLASHRRHGSVIPRLVTLAATLVNISLGTAAGERARRGALFHIRKPLRSGTIARGATSREARTNCGGEGFTEEWTQHR